MRPTLALGAAPAPFHPSEAGTDTVLDAFEAPAACGFVTVLSVEIAGGAFDVLVAGPKALVHDAAADDLGGASGQAALNSDTFEATAADGDAVTCGPGAGAPEVFDGTPGGACGAVSAPRSD